jgi:hypothetical protein
MFNNAFRSLAPAVFFAFCCIPAAWSQRSQNISIFKNGAAFIRVTDSVKNNNGISMIPAPESAQIGSLWLSSTSASISGIKMIESVSNEKIPFSGIREMLLHNSGKRVRLVLAYQDPVEATVSSIMGSYGIFKTKDRWITTDLNKIETIEFLDEPTISAQQKAKMLEVSWENIRTPLDYTMQYMRDSLGWLPEYLIQLNNNNTATLRLNATMVNNALDLRNADVHFVAGIPNFKFGQWQEPFLTGDDVRQFLNQSSSTGVRFNMLSNTMDAVINSKLKSPDGDDGDLSEGTVAGDFFFYSVKNISLAKGQQSSIPLLELTVPVRHIYSVTIPTYKYSIQSKGPRESQVYHSLELTNSGSKPWTSGSAFLVSAEDGSMKPLAQDILPYAPKNGSTEFKITVASDVKVTDSEQEISRESDQKRKNGDLYDLVTIEGQISIANYKDKSITLNVQRDIPGELVKSDVTWKTSRKTFIQDPYNPINNAAWELTLDANDQKTITYRYKVQINKN